MFDFKGRTLIENTPVLTSFFFNKGVKPSNVAFTFKSLSKVDLGNRIGQHQISQN